MWRYQKLLKLRVFRSVQYIGKCQVLCNVLFKKIITEKNRQAKDNGFLFMQDRACPQISKLTFEMLKDKEKLCLLERHPWSQNRSDLNPVDFRVWGLMEQNVLQGCRKTNLDPLKEAIVTEWKTPQEIVNKCIE